MGLCQLSGKDPPFTRSESLFPLQEKFISLTAVASKGSFSAPDPLQSFLPKGDARGGLTVYHIPAGEKTTGRGGGTNPPPFQL